MINLMSKLRTDKWKCTQWLGRDNGVDRGVCGDTATYRCNACRQEFCEECWLTHLEMSMVYIDGVISPHQSNIHGLPKTSRFIANI